MHLSTSYAQTDCDCAERRRPWRIANHLSTEELLIRYRQATEAIKRSHYQIIWLLATGKKPQEVAQVTGYTRIWIYQLVKRYNQFGTMRRLALSVSINASSNT
ncbi:MAG: helix-turn-helix domain-containing protein [Iphinoe sp. HA4291-MV1]|nr:helix-turn-helix domain-containing protein [Iphinoe sp. HA4291-MV1]